MYYAIDKGGCKKIFLFVVFPQQSVQMTNREKALDLDLEAKKNWYK